jgi:predicted nucleic acid-binding protein
MSNRQRNMKNFHYEAVAKASNECRSKRVTVSVIDVLLYAIASSRGWATLTTDSDFKSYANVLPMQLHAPRG